ncbi:MAG TPA: MFS transporter [Acidobacteriaceae bacterium]|jgi:MFS family permease|nr:MFS transporter [Acidobacteriaceae bacterium]
MPDVSHSKSEQVRTVQDYIDEGPIWPDGTRLPSVPMTQMQRLIWMLAAAGKFFEGFVVFMTGVALPLIARQFGISPTQKGMVAAASLAGILVGALGLGSLSDTFGRKSMFVVEMIIFTAFLAAAVFCTSFVSLIICLFGLGIALGCDYPTAHMIISENIPSTSRGKLVLGAFAFQAVGALGGAAVGYAVLMAVPNLDAWRWMYATAVVPALLVTVGRFFITESANWLHTRGNTERATEAARKLLVRTPQYPRNIVLAPRPTAASGHGHGGGSFLSLFGRRYRRATILASVPWFLQDLGTYGIGIFTPTILATAIGHKAEHVRSLTDLIANERLAARGDAMITTLLIIGIVCAVLLADKLGRIRLQIIGFIGCAVGLFIASLSVDAAGSLKIALIFTGFMLFDFMTNLGPNAQTYLLAGEVFPTAIRGKGAGFAAAFAKIGAVMTAFLFPILLATIGTRFLLYGLIVAFVLGAIVTWFFRIETTGVNLDRIGEEANEGAPTTAAA